MDASVAIPAPVRPAPRDRSRAAISTRIGWGLAGVGCLAVLLAGAWLKPSPAGHGSHTQLGMPPCAWAVMLGAPCPTCGMTTSVSHAVHGNFVQSFLVQPFGLLVALAAAVGVWSGAYIAATGSNLGSVYGRLMTARVLWSLAALAGAAWMYKWAVWQG